MQLQGDQAIEPAVPSQVDDRHPPPAQLAEDLEAVDLRPGDGRVAGARRAPRLQVGAGVGRGRRIEGLLQREQGPQAIGERREPIEVLLDPGRFPPLQPQEILPVDDVGRRLGGLGQPPMHRQVALRRHALPAPPSTGLVGLEEVDRLGEGTVGHPVKPTAQVVARGRAVRSGRCRFR